MEGVVIEFEGKQEVKYDLGARTTKNIKDT